MMWRKKGKVSREQRQLGHVLIAMITILIAAALLSACVSNHATGQSPEQRQRIESYLKTAAHVTPAQKQAVRQGRPFVGMTLTEADLAMRRQFPEGRLSLMSQEVTYLGRRATNYYLYFSGFPQQVTFWSKYSWQEAEQMRPIERARTYPFTGNGL